MAHAKKSAQGSLRKQGTNSKRPRNAGVRSAKAPRKADRSIQSSEVAQLLPNPKSPEQTFRDRQSAASAISKLIMEEMQKNDPRALNRRSCWLVINELYNRLCCCNEETPLDDIQKISRILIEQGKLHVLERKARSTSGKSARIRSSPLPETLSRAIRDLYGGTIKTSEEITPRDSRPVESHPSSPRNETAIDIHSDNS